MYLVFERFLSDERQVVPDIDIDFQADERERVIQYICQKYGIQYAAMACTFVTFRARSALRNVGKALGLPPELLERTSSSIEPIKQAVSRTQRHFVKCWGSVLRLKSGGS